MNSPVSWKGGKSALLKYILPRFPLQYDRYVEVFGGGGWVFFAKTPQPDDVYNDYNRHLANLFTCFKECSLHLVKELGFLPFTGRDDFGVLRKYLQKEEFDDRYLLEQMELAEYYLPPLEAQEIKTLLSEEATRFNIKQAAAMYKIIRYSYASGCTSFGCKSVDIRRFFYLIWEASRRMAGAVVENQDFEVLIRHYDAPGTFFYCDPPYFDAEDYEVCFPKEDHNRLRDLLLGIRGKFMLSYNDSPSIRELYEGKPDIRIVRFERLDNIAQRYDPGKMYGELLITNYDPDERLRSLPIQLSLDDGWQTDYCEDLE